MKKLNFVSGELLAYALNMDVICFTCFIIFDVSFVCVFFAFADKCPLGHDKVEVEAEANITTTDGFDIVNSHHAR